MSRLIDADALIEELCGDCIGLMRNGECRFGKMCGDMQVVRNAPTIDPVKHGRWEYETMRHIITGDMRTVRICSECGGGWFRYDMSDGVEDAEPNYCPNCGAYMRGEEDERPY